MNQIELLAYFDTVTAQMRKTMEAKNSDYAGETHISKDAFANFTRIEALGIASTEQGFLTRMMDKLCRITTFVQKGVLQVTDEKVNDTLLDLANYAILMSAFIHQKKTPKTRCASLGHIFTEWEKVPGTTNNARSRFCKIDGCDHHEYGNAIPTA